MKTRVDYHSMCYILLLTLLVTASCDTFDGTDSIPPPPNNPVTPQPVSSKSAVSLIAPQDYKLYDIVFIDENVGFLTGNRIYRTIDGGARWVPVSLPEGPWYDPQFDPSGFGSILNIDFLNEKEGFAVYQPCDPG